MGLDLNKPSKCNTALSVEQAKPILDAGLCKTPANFLHKPVCEEWKAFLNGGSPKLNISTFALGATFRVERAMNGKILWSEYNPMFALYNAGNSDKLESIRLLDIEAENPQEEKEATQYLESVFSGRHDVAPSLEKYILEMRSKAEEVKLDSSDSGSVGNFGCSTIHLRQKGKRLYALISTKHGNTFEYDSHPVLYFVIFSPR